MKKLVFVLAAFVGLMLMVPLALVIDQVAHAHSGSPSATTWSNGQTLTHTALNDTISHLHNTFSGGIVNAHISTAAAIDHTKLATPGLVPKALVAISTCSADPCTIVEDVNVTSVGWTSTGVYTVTLDYTPTDSAFFTNVNSVGVEAYCQISARATAAPQITVRCYNNAGTLTNVAFSLVVLDAN